MCKAQEMECYVKEVLCARGCTKAAAKVSGIEYSSRSASNF